MISQQFRTKAKEAAQFLTVLGNARRLTIMGLLSDRELSVEELRQQLGLSSSALSQHMTKLKALDLLSVRREKNSIFYSSTGDMTRDLFAAALRRADGSGPPAQKHDFNRRLPGRPPRLVVVMKDQALEIATYAQPAADLLWGMSGENRFLILLHLTEGEVSVGDLAERVGIRSSALSHQLKDLRALGLVTRRRDKQTLYYSCQSAPVLRVIQFMETLVDSDDKPSLLPAQFGT
ncbi:metalloregulator ArsR/SmtB family transcription factor [Mesorhizobium sp. 2RAF45]|uniref:metalloregulator ArsR/SmtB family transcription factor n=1 Tax=Mesorhizobium sp. 2RAF45 TaxID=3233001 RepID=UPI003F957976